MIGFTRPRGRQRPCFRLPTSPGAVSRAVPGVIGGILALTAATACGGAGDDDGGSTVDGGGGSSPDGGTSPDAAQPDAAPAILRNGTIAIMDTTVTNPLALGGAVAQVSYIDTQTVTVPPISEEFDEPVNGCLITVYHVAAGETEPTHVDEGAVHVTGTASGAFTCSFAGALGAYACQSDDDQVRGGTPGNAATATLNVNGTFTLDGAGFTPAMQGMTIELSGFTGVGGGSADGRYPIAAVPDRDTLKLGGQIPLSAIGGAEATFTTFVGESLDAAGAAFDFLDDGTASVTIAKEYTALSPAFTVSARARGEGMVLDASGAQPDQFPDTAQDLTFSCTECGADPEQDESQLIPSLIVSGRTTDVLPAPGDDDGLAMPAAQTSFATFTCTKVDDSALTIPSAGVEAILATNPARIQVAVGRVIGSVQNAPQSAANVVIGHSLTGFTTLK